MITSSIELEPPYSLVRKKVGRLVRLSRISLQDREDVEQALIAELLRKWSRFDPRRGSVRGFASVVVDRAALNLLRDRDAPSRKPPPRETLPVEEIQARPRRMAEELVALKHDVDSAVATLPPDERDLANRLKVDSLTTVARQLNIPRSTLASGVRKIRKRFESRGLQRYVR